MSSRSRTLYIGVTSTIKRCVWQHKNGVSDGFATAYRCRRLAYLEQYQYASSAVAREKQPKRWARSKKLALIEGENPLWLDLSEDWGNPAGAAGSAD